MRNENGDINADMNSFFLPFLLTLAMAVPVIWYHLDGTDPLDIAVQAPSQEEIDFARTQMLLGDLEADSQVSEEPSADVAGYVITVESQTPGY